MEVWEYENLMVFENRLSDNMNSKIHFPTPILPYSHTFIYAFKN